MCTGSSKGSWEVGPKGLTASPKLADSLTKALKESWNDKKAGSKRGGSGLKIPGGRSGSGGGKVGGGSSATATGGPVAMD